MPLKLWLIIGAIVIAFGAVAASHPGPNKERSYMSQLAWILEIAAYAIAFLIDWRIALALMVYDASGKLPLPRASSRGNTCHMGQAPWLITSPTSGSLPH